MNEPTDAASLRDERQVHGDHGTAPDVGEADRARARALRDALDPVAAAMGFELVDAQWSQSGRRRRLQVFLDKEGGVGLSDCATMSPVLSNALDAAEAAEPAGALAQMLAGAYVLEVSSPGLDRPLALLSQFARFVGERVKLRTMSPLSADSTQRNFTGRIEAATADPVQPEDDTLGVVVLVDEDSDTRHRIPLARIRKANLIPDWSKGPALESATAAYEDGESSADA